MFKLRPGGQPGANSPAQPPTIEAMRRRARHRLIGASVLVLAGVIGFPLLFDTQPRPIPVNIPIEIPAKNAVKPLVVPSVAPVPPAVHVDGLDAKEELIAATPATDAKPASQVDQPVKAEPPKPVEKTADKTPHANDAKDDKSTQRFVVQVGAFAESSSAQQARQKLERAGLKTYTHEATLPEGKRIRVRLGPFTHRAEAEKAAAKAKAQGLPAAILTL
jgi:DedD protein